MRLVTLLVCLLWSAIAAAHPLAPLGLELDENAPGRVRVTLTRPLVQPKGQRLVVQWPTGCEPRSVSVATEGDAAIEHLTLRCNGPLAGRALAVTGWGEAGSQVVVRARLHDGRRHETVLHRHASRTTVPTEPQTWGVLTSYGRLGVEHLLTGWDHLCFVVGLLLLVPRPRRVVLVLTAFTVGHSITLALATLGWLALPSTWVEAGIAASLLAVAVQAVEGRDLEARTLETQTKRRFPVGVALGFGLLHGLGFAGALRETGLPDGAVPRALLGFNLGIELGQLAVVAAVYLGVALAHRARRRSLGRGRLALVYGIGALASMWLFERVAVIVG